MGDPSTDIAFWDGGRTFNEWSFYIGLAGFVATVVGLTIAYRQITKARTAAEAARKAATATADKLQKAWAMIDFTRLYKLSSDAVMLIRHDNFTAAAMRVGDVRDRVVELRESPQAQNLQAPEEWQELVTKLTSLQEALERHDKHQEPGRKLKERFMRQLSKINDKLNGLAASTGHSLGEL